MSGIGTLGEMSLHAALKGLYARAEDEVEARVDGYFVDVRRGAQLVEFQTRNFAALKRKLTRLAEAHPVRLVHPIALEKWIVRVAADGQTPVSRRKSPRRGCLEHLFLELVSFPQLVAHPNFSIEVLLIREEEVLSQAGGARRSSWRRKGWHVADRRLLEVVDRTVLAGPADYAALLPPALPNPFSSGDLAGALSQPAYVAQKMAYCLREMGVIKVAGRRGRAWLYVRP